MDFVREDLTKGQETNPSYKLSSTIGKMFEKNLAEEIHSSGGIGCDNMTCVVVQFKK